MKEEGVPVREIAKKELAEERVSIVQEYRQRGMSRRDIAENMGVGKSQVQRDLEAAEESPDAGASSDAPASETPTTGLDGKVYASAAAVAYPFPTHAATAWQT